MSTLTTEACPIEPTKSQKSARARDLAAYVPVYMYIGGIAYRMYKTVQDMWRPPMVNFVVFNHRC